MSEQELKKERQVRLDEIRELRRVMYRLAFRLYVSLVLLIGVVFGVFGTWAPVQILKRWNPYLIAWIVTGWWLFLIWLMEKSGASRTLDDWKRKLDHVRALIVSHRSSIRQIDSLLREKNEHQANDPLRTSPSFSIVSGDDWELYLVTSEPDANQWLLEISDDHTSPRIVEATTDEWLSQYRKRAPNETAWPIGSSFLIHSAQLRVLTSDRREICRLLVSGRRLVFLNNTRN